MKTDQIRQVLIVDDEKAVCKFIKLTLEANNYSCHTANSVAEAKAILSKGNFDLLLSDLRMPGESGVELIRFAKEHYPDIARVMATAVDDPESAAEITEIGIYGYLVKPLERNMMLITLKNALRLRDLEMQLKSRSRDLEEKIWRHAEMLGVFMDNLDIGVVFVDQNMKAVNINQKVHAWFPDAIRIVKNQCYHSAMFPQDKPICPDCPMMDTFRTGEKRESAIQLETRAGRRHFKIITLAIRGRDGKIVAGVELMEDVTDRLVAQEQQREALRLETIGQLAAGIVHEINSPIQYVSNNITFLQDAFSDILALLDTYNQYLIEGEQKDVGGDNAMSEIRQAAANADIEFLKKEIPKAFAQSIEGVDRVRNIVRVMKDFSHPGGEEKIPTNINDIVESAVTMSKNEWKYVADVEQHLDSGIPLVPCLAGDVGRVVLNLIVNAAHAISEAAVEGSSKGYIRIRTLATGNHVQIEISDNGKGIPEHLRERVLEPFFTTKERGKGTGQGLAIAKSIIEEKHSGSLYFNSTVGEGTTFFIELPIEGVPK